MTLYCRNRIINGIFNDTINSCKKEIEVYLYRLYSLQRNIDMEFNKPLNKFNSNQFIKLILLMVKNDIKLKENFYKLIDRAIYKIKMLISR